ncbi:MAG TPA: MmcQ/YjbR family DNA-binding protein [Planctomycetota bacterium]|nr:MmcQ/YjbR family DNA-binding protein [Planctomycetota bacterium]
MSHAEARPPTAAARRLCEALRAHAFTFPETHEDHPWGEIALKVRGKVFVFLGADGDTVSFSVKLPQSADAALSLPGTQPTPYGLGKSGWVSVQVGPKSRLPRELLEAWITESWTAIAPKTLAKARAAGATVPARRAGDATARRQPGRRRASRN